MHDDLTLFLYRTAKQAALLRREYDPNGVRSDVRQEEDACALRDIESRAAIGFLDRTDRQIEDVREDEVGPSPAA